MSEPHQFRHYLIVQDADGGNVELERTADQVAVLAFDSLRLEFVHCHVLLNALQDRAAFEEACRRLRSHGHPLLTRLVDFGEDDGNPFYITGTADGEPLSYYLARIPDLPCWLAVMIASRALETAAAVCSRGDYIPFPALRGMRLVQIGAQSVAVLAADYRLTSGRESGSARVRALRANFDRQGKFLRAFLLEQGGANPTLPDQLLSAADFAELLAGCLDAASPAAISQMRDLRASLHKLVPEHVAGEIPGPQKPRALLAPLLATYQEVARGVANRVRIQSQRLDMTNPYSMRGTQSRGGRSVLVEQIPPPRLIGKRPLEAAQQAQKVTRKSDHPQLVSLPQVHQADSITCLIEEMVEGVSVADLLRQRGPFDVSETYLLLAGLDSALADLDRSGLPCQKLRLEDIFLLAGPGASKSGAGGAMPAPSRLTDWPSFSVLLRAHPCLAAMACRGTDPGLLLPHGATTSAETPSRWHGGWLAALGRFLVGLEAQVGASVSAPAPDGQANASSLEAVERLLDDEIARTIEGRPSPRAEFLSGFARVVREAGLAKPLVASGTGQPAAASATDRPGFLARAWKALLGVSPKPLEKASSADAVSVESPEGSIPAIATVQAAAPETAPQHEPRSKSEPPAQPRPLSEEDEYFEETSPIATALSGASLSGSMPAAPAAGGTPSIGLGEIFFTGSAASDSADDTPDWARGGALPSHFEVPRDRAPFWLKAAVFMLASMALGGALAHRSGQALWQRARAERGALPLGTAQPVGGGEQAVDRTALDLEELRRLPPPALPVQPGQDPAATAILPPPPPSLRDQLQRQ
jgi:hypothetical protein